MSRTRILLVTLSALVLAVPVLVDRAAEPVVAHQLADRLRCALGLRTAPEVSFGGVPFLTQLARRRFDQVRITARQVAIGPVTASQVTATARGVRLSTSDSFRAAALSIDLIVGYSGFQDKRVTAVSADDAGRLVLETTAPLLGSDIPVIVYAQPELTGQTLTIRPVDIEVPMVGLRIPAARIPAAAAARTVPLPELPAGLGYRSASATPAGLRLRIAGTNITTSTRSGIKGVQNQCGGTTR